ncbi:MAG: metallophosphoesterase family protein [Verrucomicrobiales bacterium]|jgi:putative phosphoesterase|nr:metallophosphoesterase family protein [Verrucomicrobiales bacterium]
MRVLILSDIHANWAVLEAVLRAELTVDRIICLGDLVNYGPQPAECVDWALQVAKAGNLFLQGNHDHAVGLGADPRCSSSYRLLALTMQKITIQLTSKKQKEFLSTLQPLRQFVLGEHRCVACHATPRDALFTYLPKDATTSEWEEEIAAAGSPDYLFVGHTHVPMKLKIGKTIVINPGSVGQPKNHDPRASYVLWEDGKITFHAVDYDVEATIHAYRGLGLEAGVASPLFNVLRSGGKFAA